MEEILQEKDYLKSSDICLCCALDFYGYRVEAIDKQNPSRVIFLVKRDDQIDDLIAKHFKRELRVEPLAFFNCLKQLKTRIYNVEQ